MAFANDVVIADSVPANQTYSLISMNAGRSLRSNAARPVNEPAVLTISHESIKKTSKNHYRHLVRLDLTELDADGVTPYTGYVYCVIGCDDRVISESHLQDLVIQLKNFLSSGNVTKILHNEP